MDQKKQYLEKGHHGTRMFPVEYYDCVYPINLAGLPVHWHEEFEITYVRKGSCTYLIDLIPCQVKEGDFLFLPSGMLHGIPEGDLKLLETDSFVFHPGMLGGMDACGVTYILPLEKGEIQFPSVISLSDSDDLLKKSFVKLKKNFLEKEPGYELAVKASLLEIILALYRQVPFRHEDGKNKEVLNRLRAVIQYIKENYQRQVTVAELAAICHFSEYYFMRFFKQYMNTTCIEYINQYRLEIAAGKLLSGMESVTDIALDTGFHNISYFNRVFKKNFGITPKEYRKAFRKTET